jgi:two-component system, response regulator PdtaR
MQEEEEHMGSRAPNRSIVLIVEDEPLIQMLAMEIVERAGHTTLVASNASEALQILEQTPTIGVVFTDVKMPGVMDGTQLAWEIRNRWPHMGIVVASGYVPDTAIDLPEGVPFLAKPYHPVTLEKMISKAA